MTFGLKKIDSLIGKITTNSLKKKGFYETKIITEWEYIIGKQYADVTMPMKIVSDRENKKAILHISLSNPALAVEINHVQDLIIERIATYFGYKAITGIKIKTLNLKY